MDYRCKASVEHRQIVSKNKNLLNKNSAID